MNNKNHIRNIFLLNYLFFIAANNDHVYHFQRTLGHLRPTMSLINQTRAAQELIQRIIGIKSNLFEVNVDPNIGPLGKDTFQIIKINDRRVKITGTTGVAVTWGFYYYLKTYCNCHISWEYKQVELPRILSDVNETIIANDRFRYYQNVCTAGYSTTWWDWNQWEKNIDWMALNGINLALAFHAQEAIWQRVYLKLNLTQEEIDEHFGGPAFLPWTRMGNIRGWGGPLPQSWHQFTIDLQHKILERMRSLGIIPVLPAFAGHVPRAFERIYPDANMTKINPWNGFQDEYCCPYLLSPQDPLFKIIGRKFLEEYIAEFGTDHVYNCDTFNENEPLYTDLETLSDIGRAIYEGITAVDSQAIWLLQGWLFVDKPFWTPDRVRAFITSVPIGKMIILDLQSEQFPQYEKFDSYYGQPFIWCMLHNFGGTLGMFGSAPIINQRVFEARNMNGSTMIGTGLTPEGINQNYVIYELMNEMAYRQHPVELDSWFENYAARRYGAWNKYAVKAWNNLKNSVYNFSGNQKIRGRYVITKRPASKRKHTFVWYKPEDVYSAWKNLLSATSDVNSNDLIKYDLVDVTRQSLQLIAEDIYRNLKNSYMNNKMTAFINQKNLFLEIFDDLEQILRTNRYFLLGRWIEDAKKLGTNSYEKDLYEFNARNQITLWGPNGEIRDYANKQWADLITDYYQSRWRIYLNALSDKLMLDKSFKMEEIRIEIFQDVERAFTRSRKQYLTTPTGDSIQISNKLFTKWNNRGFILTNNSLVSSTD